LIYLTNFKFIANTKLTLSKYIEPTGVFYPTSIFFAKYFSDLMYHKPFSAFSLFSMSHNQCYHDCKRQTFGIYQRFTAKQTAHLRNS